MSQIKLVCNPTIQLVNINLLTKYEYSTLEGLCEICYEKLHYSKYGVKEKQIDKEKNTQEKAGSHSHDTARRHEHTYQIFKVCTVAFDEKFHSLFKVL